MQNLTEITRYLSHKAKYIGCVPVASSIPSADLWKMFGQEIVGDAYKKLKQLKPKPTTVSLTVSPLRIAVEDSDGVLIDDESPADLKYVGQVPSEKKKIAYVLFYKRIELIYCHIVTLSDTRTCESLITEMTAAMIASRKIRDEAFGFNDDFIFAMTKPEAFSSDSKEKATQGEIVSLGKIIGVVEDLRYVGTVPLKVKGTKAMAVNESDVTRGVEHMFRELARMTKSFSKKERHLTFASRKDSADSDPQAGLPVVLVVTSEGIRTIDNISREQTHNVFLRDLMHFSRTDFPKGLAKDNAGNLFVSVSRDERLRHVRLRVYRSREKGRADAACEAIRAAFKAADRADELRHGQPFLPTASLTLSIDNALMKLEVDRHTMTPVRPVGAGQFGLVFMSTLNSDNSQLATKVLRPGASPESLADFLREAEILQQLDHQNVVVLRGVCLRQQPWLIIEDFALFGDLDKVLSACREKQLSLTDAEMLTIISQIVKGMTYVASQGVVHGDVAARNCLLHIGNAVKIADFGWARKLPAGEQTFNRPEIPKISTRWLAIEAIRDREFSEKTDVWATSVTLWECFSYGQTPYGDVHFLQVERLVREGLRLERPLNCPYELWKQMTKCWSSEKKARPTFQELDKRITDFVSAAARSEEWFVRDIGKTLTEVSFEEDGGGDVYSDLAEEHATAGSSCTENDTENRDEADEAKEKDERGSAPIDNEFSGFGELDSDEEICI